jgi:hypothetical protein
VPIISGGGGGGSLSPPVTLTGAGAGATLSVTRSDAADDVLDAFTVNGGGVFVAQTGGVTIQPDANTIPLVVSQSGSGGGTADLLDLTTGLGVIVARVSADGAYRTLVHAAPADASIQTGELALWFDQTAAAAKLMVKAKDAGGTVRTATINLA